MAQSFFRKHQKVLLAVLGVFCMLAFVVLPMLGKIDPRDTQVEDVVAVWRHGKITNADVVQRRQMRLIVNQFVEGMVRKLVDNMSDGRLGARYRLLGYPLDDGERTLVESIVLARKAEEMGLQIPDDAITQYINFVGDKKVDKGQVQEVISVIQVGGRQLDEYTLFAALREELKVRRVKELAGFDAQSHWDQTGRPNLGVTPAQRWEYYSRLYREVTAEFMPVEVEPFVDEIRDPTDEELSAWYEEYKEEFQLPDSPEPGFRTPQMATLEYVKLDRELVQAAARKQVSEEEIVDYYEANKREKFRKLVPPSFEQMATDRWIAELHAREDSKKSPAPEALLPPEPEDPVDRPKQKSQPAPSSGSSHPGSSVPGGPKTGSPKASDPAETGDDASGGGREKANNSAEGSSDTSKSTGQQEAAPKGADVIKSGKSGNKDNPVSDAADDSAKPDRPETSAAPDESSTKSAGPPQGPYPPEPPLTDVDRYVPLSVVRDQIVNALADEKAEALMKKNVNEVLGKMTRHHRRYDQWRVLSKDSDKSAETRPTFDLSAVADEDAAFTYHKTPIWTEQQFDDAGGIGDAYVTSTVEVRRRVFGADPLRFDKRTAPPLYNPTSAIDLDGNSYVYWIADQKADEIPSLAEVREQVIHSWKIANTAGENSSARARAQAQADKFARQAGLSGASLADEFPENDEIFTTEPFTWLRPDSQPLSSGDIVGVRTIAQDKRPEIKDPSESFMRTVFALKKGEVGTVANQAKSIVYVVRIADEEKSLQQLREDFARHPYIPGRSSRERGYFDVSVHDRVKFYNDWITDVFAQYELKWERTPKSDDDR